MCFQKKKRAMRRGSVLVFTLFILLFLLIAALSVANLATSESKGTIALNRSAIAFQIADSGMEILLERIYSGSYDAQPLRNLAPSGGNCNGGEITGSFANGAYAITVYDVDGDLMTDCGSTVWRRDIESLQSTGSYGGTTRAVKVDVDPR